MRDGKGIRLPEPIDPVQIPYYFRCPISLELMSDPVTISTGQTYDRCSIESWISTGNTTCPVTRSPIPDFSLIPNHTLRRLIQEWCVAHHSQGFQRIPTPKQPADLSLLRSLLSHSSPLSSLPASSRLSSLSRLARLARDDDKNRSLLSSIPNSCPVLISILFDSASDSDSDLRREALSLLALLHLSEFDCVSIASDPDRVSFLIALLFGPDRVSAAAVIEAVVAGVRSAEARCCVSGAEGVFEGVVGVIKDGGAGVGVRALFALCLAKQHRQRAVGAGAAEALIDVLAASGEKGEAERAVATVELLCRVPAGCAAFAAHPLTAPVLVGTILKVSERATEYAAGALLAVCSASERAQREAVGAGLMTQLLLLVQSDCTDRAKRKAQLLLKLLRSSWPDDDIAAHSNHYFHCSDVAPY